MCHLEDVAAGLADQRRRAGEVARGIGHADPDRDHALGVHEAPQDHHGQQAQIDVAAAQHQPDAPANEALAIGGERGETDGAGTSTIASRPRAG